MVSLRDKIISKVSIPDIYPKKLVRNRGNCTTHDNTSSPSFTYYPQTNSWYCWSCGKGGSVIDLYGHINNLSYRESMYELAKTYQIEISEKEKEIIEKESDIFEIFSFFCDICHENFLNSDYYEKEKIKRGFTEKTIKEFKIGLFDESIKNQMNKKFDQQSLFNAGFLSDKLHWEFGKRIVYPYLNMKGDPVYFIYRKIDEEPDFRENHKYVKQRKEYIQESLFGLNSTNKYNGGKPLIITEGITDCISVIQEEFPCVSPVTIRFKNEDLEKIVKYAKRFEKVVVINDNEENQKGLEGATKTLQYLLRRGINVYISEIPKPVDVDKIDLDEYLRIDGKDKLKELTEDSIEGFKYLLSFVDKESTTEDMKDILILVNDKDIKKQADVINALSKKTGVGKRELKILYKDVKLTETEEFGLRDDIFAIERYGRRDLTIYNSYEYKNGTIENREDGVFFIAVNADGVEYEFEVLESPLKLIHKTKYQNTDLFSYEFRGDIYNTQNRSDIFLELKEFMYEGERGRDVLKKLITCLGDELEYTNLEPVLGWNDNWILPQLQEENNYRILVSTDFQKDVYNNCKNIYSDKYDIKEIKNKIIEFLNITEMHKGKVAMIIGWSIAQLFRLSFIKYWRFAPDLLLIGDPQTGKTAFGEVMITNFFKAWKSALQGAQIATKSSFEDVASSSTFPVLVDELEYVNYEVTDPMKARASMITDFSRKIDAKKKFSKPEVAGFCITTNKVPQAFYNNALIERYIVISYASDEVIDEKQEWNDVARELKKLNTFSPIYDISKNWDDEKIFRMIRTVQRKCPLFTYDARLRKKFIFILFGLTLFDSIFDIDLASDLEIFLFEKSGRIITGDLLNDFINFCNIALNYDYGSTTAAGTHVKGDNPKFLTAPLLPNSTDDYIFTPNNLRDFKEFISDKKYIMGTLTSQLNKAVGEKDYFEYGRFSLEGKTYTAIKIKKDFNEHIKKLKT